MCQKCSFSLCVWLTAEPVGVEKHINNINDGSCSLQAKDGVLLAVVLKNKKHNV